MDGGGGVNSAGHVILALLIAAITAALLLNAAAALYFADVFTRPRRRRVEGTPGDLGLRYEDVQFRAADGVILRGWYLDSPGARASVLLIHDTDATRADPEHGLLELIRDYVRRGHNVFSFDLRGRGESSGTRDRLGSAELLDVMAAVAVARRRAPELPLVMHGFGLGGSLAIVAAAGDAPASVVIADSAFSTAREQLRHEWPRLPAYLFGSACWMARALFHADADAIQPIRAIAHVQQTPVLLVHGSADRTVPVAQAVNVAAATLHERHDLWVVPGVDHCGAYLSDRSEYVRRCLAFIEQTVPMRQLASAG